jgi:hypothetical protein
MIDTTITLPAETTIHLLSGLRLALPAETVVTVVEQARGGWIVADADGDHFAVTADVVRKLTAKRCAVREAAIAKAGAERRRTIARIEDAYQWGDIDSDKRRRLIADADGIFGDAVRAATQGEVSTATDGAQQLAEEDGDSEEDVSAQQLDRAGDIDPDLAATLGIPASHGRQAAPQNNPFTGLPARRRRTPSQRFAPMPQAVEAMIAAVAPTFEQDGLAGVFVKSRTPEAQRQQGEHLHAYHVTGAGRARACNCPAGRRGRRCWHVSAAQLDEAWEVAARQLYAVLTASGSASPEVKGRAIVATWQAVVERTPRTARSGKPDLVRAMSEFVELASAITTRLQAQRAHAAAARAAATIH